MINIRRVAATVAALTMTAGLTTGVTGVASAAPAPPDGAKAAAQVRADAEKRGAFYQSPVSTGPALRSSNGSSTSNMPTDPSGPWLTDCLRSDEAKSGVGRVYNRFQWCKKGSFKADFYKFEDGQWKKKGTNYLAYDAAGIGYNDKRSTRVFFRVTSTSINWPLLQSRTGWRMPLEFGVQCEQMGLFCSVDKAAIQKQWQDLKGLGWVHWNVFGNEAGAQPFNNPDKVSFHKWNFTFDASKDGEYKGDVAQGDKIGIRCDSAEYFPNYPYACVYTGALPFLTYSASNLNNGQVARHIRDAQNSPNSTYPKEPHDKRIPGKWSASAATRGEPLHRIDRDGEYGQRNENLKKSACGQNTTQGNPWAPYYTPATGLPVTTAPDQQCDEYPFGSTWEGAASPDYDFSVRWVDKSHNGSAGGVLNGFYTRDRILRYTHVPFGGTTPSGPSADPFWVEIAN